MRKTSQDGGDSTSITSGIENEVKKPVTGIIKAKRNSIKKKVQNFSHESDDAVIEPLLQKDKSSIPNSSAKHLLSKGKTESSEDKDKLLSSQIDKPSLTTAPSAIAGASLINGTKDNNINKTFEHSNTTIHNHMHTNVFSTLDRTQSAVPSESQILVEIDGNKPTSYNPSPLIFTTAKIHADGKTKHMEPVQVTPVPILSTIEGSLIKIVSSSDKVSSGSSSKFNNIISSTNDSKVPKEQSFSNAISDYNYASCSGLANRYSIENNAQNESKKKAATSNFSTNDSTNPVISVGVNIILPAKTIKPEAPTSGTLMDITDKFDIDINTSSIIDRSVGNIIKIDVNKNIQPMSNLGQRPLNEGTRISDMSGNKHLQRQKTATIHESDKDVSVSYVDSSLSNGNKRHKNVVDSSLSNGKLPHIADHDKSSKELSSGISTLTSIANYSYTSKSAENDSITKTVVSTPISEFNIKSTGITVTPKVTSTTSSTATVGVIKNTVTSANEPSMNKSPINSTLNESKLTNQISAKPSLLKTTATTTSSEIPNKEIVKTTSSIITSTAKSVVTVSNITSILNPTISTATTAMAKPIGIATTLTSKAKPEVMATVVTTTNTSAEKPAIKTSADKIAVSQANTASSIKSVLTSAPATSTIKAIGTTSAIDRGTTSVVGTSSKLAASKESITTTTKNNKPGIITSSTSKSTTTATVTLPASTQATKTANYSTTVEKSISNTASKPITLTVNSSVSTLTPSGSSSTKSNTPDDTEIVKNSSSNAIRIAEKNNVPKSTSKTSHESVINRPQAVTTATSSVTSSKITKAPGKTQDNSIQSTSLISTVTPVSKPMSVSTTQSTTAIKQTSAETSTSKKNSGTGNSVKTLITSNEKSSKSSGSASSGTIGKTSFSSKSIDSKTNDRKN